ncbi:uncharacterized protein LOC109841592, partial [Asparagus officinalis]|uniref:uncharacterized protein LOC109841592 n=1 Tax=Asparagus officinalis TaxID=4686 RepID=UPI00098E4CBA
RRLLLHNFSFPPTLSWGNQRVLRCVNLTSSPAGGNLTDNLNIKSDSKRPEEEAESSPARPWNLRTRRANPNRISNPNPSQNLNRSSSLSPSPTPILEADKGNLAKRERSEGEKGERCKFAVALTREEIEQDFLNMKGSKPPRRPKKRAKYIQRQLDSFFPGLWLSEITPDLYKIEVEKT